jgi:hypothetical protein
MSGWHPPLHPILHPVSRLVAYSDVALRDHGAAYLAVAKAQLAGDNASDTTDASSALDVAFEDFQEIQNRNAEHWHRGPGVDITTELAETFYLKGRVAEKATVGRPDLGWTVDFYRRAAEQVTPTRNFYHDELGAFRAREAQSMVGR